MTSWASPRDVYPSSVHDLMSLWGDFSTAPNSDRGVEKRFEVDFATEVSLDDLSIADIEIVLAASEQYLLDQSIQGKVLALTFTQALAIFNGQQLIFSADPSVHLHKIIAPLMKLLKEKNIVVEWASFSRKNINSPWEHHDTCDIMACEYAELKAVFATGQSFLSGPIDGEHFFHFIFDDIQRSENVDVSRLEEDVQLSVYLYDIQKDSEEEEEAKDTQNVAVLENGSYEISKRFPKSSCATFETNAPSSLHDKSRVEALLKEHSPARFTLISLEDRDATIRNINKIFQFDNYVAKRKTVNYFGHGYAFHQMNFEKIQD